MIGLGEDILTNGLVFAEVMNHTLQYLYYISHLHMIWVDPYRPDPHLLIMACYQFGEKMNVHLYQTHCSC